MSAAQALAAKAPAFAIPAMQGMAPPEARAGTRFMPPLASLAAIPALPAVQRKCGGCAPEEREEMPVQPRLEVGPVGDRYEREADTIAGQVMAMRGAGISGAAPAVQRACAACSASDDAPRARRSRHARADGGPETIGASHGELTHGGAPLPRATRDYFETRMGRDLSGVRIHQGGGAHALNSAISARAFTYRDHIWLGEGESAGPTFTLAHELAHVMQQTAPGPVGPAPARVMRTYYYEEQGKSLPTTHDEVVNWATVTDKTTFAEVPVPNFNASGFAKVKKRFGRADLISFAGSTNMVPIGMATAVCPTDQHGYWYCGASSDGFGVRKPATLDVGIDPIRHQGAIWPGHDTQSLPRYGEIKGGAKPKMGFIRDAGGAQKAAFPSVTNPGNTVPAPATTKLAIGDVKAGAFPGARKKAVDQIRNYMFGFQQTVRHYEDIRKAIETRRAEIAAAGKNDFSMLPPPLTPWEVTAGLIEQIGSVKVTTKLNDKPKPIILKKWTSDGFGGIAKSEAVAGATATTGNLVVWREVGKMAGAWSYLWTPIGSEAATLHAKLADDPDFRLHSDAAYCLRDALTLPIDKSGKPVTTTASRAPACLKPLRLSSSAPMVRRDKKTKPPAAPPRTDQFADHFKDWSAKQSKLGTNFATYQASAKGKDRSLALAELEARQNVADAVPAVATGLSMRKPEFITEQGKEALKEQGLLNFWLETMGGRSGAVLGGLRLRFGSLFVRLFNGYQTLKARITEHFAKLAPDKSHSDRLGRVALRLVVRILGSFANFVMPQISQALVNCAEQGIRAKIDALFSDGPLAAVREKIAEAEEFAASLTDGVVEKMAKIGDTMFGDLVAKVNRVKEAAALIGRIVGYAKTAFDLVRVAICGTGVGCIISAADKLLGLVGLSPIERLAERVLGTCYGQTLLGKVLLSFGSVAALPKTIAAAIVDKLKDLLPGPAAELLCDTEKMLAEVKSPKLSEITCGRGGSPDAVPGPAADGSYKGDWTPPEGYPDAATAGKIAKAEAEEKAAAAAGAQTPPPPPPATAPDKADAKPPPAPASGSGSAADQASAPGGRTHSVRPGKVTGDLASSKVYLYVDARPPFDSNKVYDVYLSIDVDGVAYGPDLVKARILTSPKPKGPPTVVFELVEDSVFEVHEGDTISSIGLEKNQSGSATLEAQP